MERNNSFLSICKLAIIVFISLLFSCKDYKNEDFCGEWYYKNTRYILHEDGTLEVYNLDSVFVYWDDTKTKFNKFNREYSKGTWNLREIKYESPRLLMEYDSLTGAEYFIKDDDELIYYTLDPDDWNSAVIIKKRCTN